MCYDLARDVARLILVGIGHYNERVGDDLSTMSS